MSDKRKAWVKVAKERAKKEVAKPKAKPAKTSVTVNSSYTKNHEGATTNKDTNKRIAYKKTRIAAAGRKVPEYDVDAAKSSLGKTVDKILDYANRPQQALMVGAREFGKSNWDLGEAAKGIKAGITGKDHYYGNELLEDLGVKSTPAKVIGGIAFDIASDPLNMVSLGAGSLGKGLITGKAATASDKAVDAYKAYKKSQIARDGLQSVLREEGVNTAKALGKKFGMTADDAADAATKLSYSRALGRTGDTLQGIRGAEKSVIEKSLDDMLMKQQAEFNAKKAGRGLSIGDTTLLSGEKMQNIGAKLGKSLENIPVAGKAVAGARDMGTKLFNPSYVAGLDAASQDVYKSIRNSAKGMRNIMDAKLVDNITNLAKLDDGISVSGLTAGDVPVTNSLRNAVQDIVSGALKLDATELGKSVATDASKLKAARALGLGDNATVGDVINYYKKTLGEAGNAEYKIGKLKNVVKDGKYFPRLNTEASRRLSSSKGAYVSNAFRNKRNTSYNGKTIKELNDMFHEKHPDLPAGLDMFEEDSLRAYAVRMLTHNQVMVDTGVVDDVLNTFGMKLKTPKDLDRAIAQGMEIVVPTRKVRLYNAKDVANTIGDAGVIGKEVKGNGMAALEKVFGKDDALAVLSNSDAANILAIPKMSHAVVALPSGLAQNFNKVARQQTNEGLAAMKAAADKFNAWWKPMVTSLNVGFHERNLLSGSFNTFMDVGTDMFSPDTQRIAASVAGRKLGNVGKASVNIKGKAYSADEIYDMMVRNNAISAYGASDATDLMHGAYEDVARLSKGESLYKKAERVGRGAGNVTESYIRATQFVANLKRGLSPEQAAEMVRKYQFDYTELTEFEKAVKRAVPFYTWLKNNFPLQLKSVFDTPAPYAAVKKAQRDGADATGIDMSQVPSYFSETGAVPYDYDPETGKAKLFNLGSPMSDLYATGGDLINMIHPAIKAPIELSQNQSLLTGATLYKNDAQAAEKFTNSGRRPQDMLVQALGNATESLTGENLVKKAASTETGMDVAKYLDYALNNLGLISNMSKYGSAEDTSNKVLQTHQDRYGEWVPDKDGLNAVLHMIAGAVDPHQLQRWYDPELGEYYQGLAYDRQLGDYMADQKALGQVYETINQLKSNGKFYKHKQTSSLK